MNKLFNWTKSSAFDNKWDRMVQNEHRIYIAAWISVDAENIFTACIMNLLPGGEPIITATFPSLEDAKSFADTELVLQLKE